MARVVGSGIYENTTDEGARTNSKKMPAQKGDKAAILKRDAKAKPATKEPRQSPFTGPDKQTNDTSGKRDSGTKRKAAQEGASTNSKKMSASNVGKVTERHGKTGDRGHNAEACHLQ